MKPTRTFVYGTHNSCTYGSLQGCCTNILLPWTQNQTLTLQEQLDRGIRWFDLRLSYSTSDGQLYVSHSMRTEHRFADMLNTLLAALPHSPLLFMHLRVDYQDRANASVIQPIVASMLETYRDSLATRADCGATLAETTISQKVLIYCADGTLQHPLIAALELMPTVSFWNAGTIEECQRRLNHLEDEYNKQQNGPFLFSKDRMILFDYSTTNMLWYTDMEQLELIRTYRLAIVSARPTILAGNMIQEIIDIF